jgi:hypothetical protein
MVKQYIYTHHVIDRLKERFDFNWEWDNRYEVYKQLDVILNDSKEDRSYLNNTKFLLYLRDLYGYDEQYEFMANAEYNLLFVAIRERGKKVVKTCWPLNSSQFNCRKQYKKKDDHKRYTPRSKKKRRVLNELEAIEEYIEGDLHGNL